MKRSMADSIAAPLPVAKPKDYESFLQGHLNTVPNIGYKKLRKALEDSVHVTCNEQAIRTWLDKHEPVVVEPACTDYEFVLLEQLASKPLMGYKLLCRSFKNAKGVTIREGPMRAWLMAYKGSSASIGPMPVQGNSSPSSGRAMAVLDLTGLSDYTKYLRQQLLEASDISVMAMRDKLIGAHGVSCSQQTMKSWLEREDLSLRNASSKERRATCRRLRTSTHMVTIFAVCLRVIKLWVGDNCGKLSRPRVSSFRNRL